ncbi:MAG TPA: DUF4331 domain-containing protein [Candidatus Cryosericum sp.]|nr:DUF4331 domain-containing protein [Candidatus Cryosericum sp.]
MIQPRTFAILMAGLIAAGIAAGTARASSHMDAPLITLDPAANTTDVYAFVAGDGPGKRLVLGLSVYPFEEPGIGPNKFNFDDDVLYEIHVALGRDLARGEPTLSYQFRFTTTYKNSGTILPSYLGVIDDVDDAAQNLTQAYTVTKLERRSGRRTILGSGLVPPNNQGIATPRYNQEDDGNNPAKEGVSSEAELDRYTAQSIALLRDGYRAFAGQRDDGFYGDIQGIFDLLQLGRRFDSQGGFNVHFIGLEVPIRELDGERQVAGVYATTSRQRFRVLRDASTDAARTRLAESVSRAVDGARRGEGFVQVGRQGNPLFCEGLVAIADKDLYNRTQPSSDSQLFRRYAESPELARLLNLLVVPGSGLRPAVETGRTDIAGIFIPDLIRVDLSTRGARLAGGGPDHPTNPDDPGYSRLGVFGGDVLQSAIQDPLGNGGFIPGGWPNGRRFGDDVVDIAVTALLSDLRTLPLFIQGPVGDGVDRNDVAFNKIFPYEPTPQNGRRHAHHGTAQ